MCVDGINIGSLIPQERVFRVTDTWFLLRFVDFGHGLLPFGI